jgi:hypothetical protein
MDSYEQFGFEADRFTASPRISTPRYDPITSVKKSML